MYQRVLYDTISRFNKNAARGAFKQVSNINFFESGGISLLKTKGMVKGGFPVAFSIQVLRNFWSGGMLASPEMLL